MENEKELLEKLTSIEKHLESLVKLTLADFLNSSSLDETELKVYQLTGSKTRDEICKDLKISPNTIGEIRNKLLQLGLLIKDGNSFNKIL